MKKVFKSLLIAVLSIMAVSGLILAGTTFEFSNWKTRDGYLGSAEKIWDQVHTQYVYFYKNACIVFEGDTENAYETTLQSIEPTADNTISLPNATGTVLLSTLATNAAGVANSLWFGTNQLIFEGATANDYEGVITPADVTADRTWTFSDASGTVFLSSLSTNAQDAANSVWGGTNNLTFEMATANAYEVTLAPLSDGAAADIAVTFPSLTAGVLMLSTLTTNDVDVANSIWSASNALVFEGATADAYELSLVPADVTADRTITLPDYTGGVPLVIAQGTTQTLLEDTTAVDITGSSLSIAAGWMTAGKAIKYTLGGTKTGANGTAMVLVDIGGTLQTITSGGNTAGDWMAVIIVSENTGTANQDIISTFTGADGSRAYYDAGTTDVSGAVTLKLQLDLGHADDAITCEYIVVEHWVK